MQPQPFTAIGPNGLAKAQPFGDQWAVQFKGSTTLHPDREAAVWAARVAAGTVFVH